MESVCSFGFCSCGHCGASALPHWRGETAGLPMRCSQRSTWRDRRLRSMPACFGNGAGGTKTVTYVCQARTAAWLPAKGSRQSTRQSASWQHRSRSHLFHRRQDWRKLHVIWFPMRENSARPATPDREPAGRKSVSSGMAPGPEELVKISTMARAIPNRGHAAHYRRWSQRPRASEKHLRPLVP